MPSTEEYIESIYNKERLSDTNTFDHVILQIDDTKYFMSEFNEKRKEYELKLNTRQEYDKAIRDAECIFVCVGTPQNPDGSADLSQLEAVANTIAENISEYKLI